MDISPWIPCVLAIVALFICLLQLWFAPIPKTKDNPPTVDASQTVDGVISSSSVKRSHNRPIKGLRETLLQKNMLLALPVFLTGSLRYTVLSLLVQYASYRFGLKISTSAYFYTETAVANIVLFLVLVPILNRQLRQSYKISQPTIDLLMVRISVLFLAFGSLLLGLSSSSTMLPFGKSPLVPVYRLINSRLVIFIFASGFGSRVFTLSLVTNWVPDDRQAALYASIAILQDLGHILGDPALQQLFAATLSLHLAPFWQGLPFFVTSVSKYQAMLCTLLRGTLGSLHFIRDICPLHTFGEGFAQVEYIR